MLFDVVSRSRPFPFYYAEEGKGRLRETSSMGYWWKSATNVCLPTTTSFRSIQEKAASHSVDEAHCICIIVYYA